MRPAAYVPIDISGEYLRDSAARVDGAIPALPVHPVEADFTDEVVLPEAIADLPRLGFFPGSTIGNFVPRSATDLLRHFRDILGVGSKLLIGMDRVKPVDRLIAAYDDPEGVTAAFNLNLLDRINRELGGDIDVDAFAPPGALARDDRADRNAPRRRARHQLHHRRDALRLCQGASIHTENSHKYGPRGARLLLLAGGWTPLAEWTDAHGRFRADPGRGAAQPLRAISAMAIVQRGMARLSLTPCSTLSSTSST